MFFSGGCCSEYLARILWEPPTVQNRQLPRCSKSRRYLFATACSMALGTHTQALPTQHPYLKLQCSLVSARPSDQSIKMRPSGTLVWFTDKLATSEHQISDLLVATSQPAPPETASIASARHSQLRSRLENSSAASLLRQPVTTEDSPAAEPLQGRTSSPQERTPSNTSQTADTTRAPPGYGRTALLRAPHHRCYYPKLALYKRSFRLCAWGMPSFPDHLWF
jgi:hypothetical protein